MNELTSLDVRTDGSLILTLDDPSCSSTPSRRLMVVAKYDNDVPEYWEWSGQGLFPFDTSNEAYKLGVNDLIYGMTH